MSRYLFTICGRAGSKGIRGKNSSVFLGVPLVYYTLAVVELFREAHPEAEGVLALNTDSDALRRLVDESGVAYEFVPRSEDLAGDKVGKVDVIRATYRAVRERGGGGFDATVDLDITSPLRTLGDLEALLDRRSASEAGVVFTVAPSRRNPWFNMVRRDADGTCSKVMPSDFTARQQAPEVFDMNASMYAYSSGFMEGGGQMFDWPCDFTVMRDTAVLDLDDEGDLELMQVVARHLFDRDEGMRAVRYRATDIAKRAEGGSLKAAEGGSA